MEQTKSMRVPACGHVRRQYDVLQSSGALNVKDLAEEEMRKRRTRTRKRRTPNLASAGNDPAPEALGVELKPGAASSPPRRTASQSDHASAAEHMGETGSTPHGHAPLHAFAP